MISAPARPPRDRRPYRATRLREVLVELDIAQAEVARDLGVTRPVVNQYCNGYRHMPIERAERIASFIGRPVSELFEPVGP
jgi:transcriptional regulator with XRE-family HTH domain